MSRSIVLASLFAMQLLALPALATPESGRHSGHLCHGATAADRAQINYTSAGATNADTGTSRVVYCGNRWVGSIANTNSISAQVGYLDRSSVDSLSCRLEVMNSAGTVYTGPWSYSCSSAGGCTTPTASYTNSAPNYLSFAVTHPVIGMYSFAVRCTIGRSSSTLGASAVLSYTIGHDAVGF